MKVLGIHGVGSWCKVIRSDNPCHCMPRLKAPSAPPMIRSAARNSPGPMVLANAGTRVVRLRKLVKAFCSMVSGCRRAPRRCVCLSQSSVLGNSAAKCGSQKAMWRQSIALRIGPFVHVEAVDVLARNAPFPEKIDRPPIHTHWADRQDQNKRPACLACQVDLTSDFVPHVGIEVLVGTALDRLE